jgi:hypothetical protein
VAALGCPDNKEAVEKIAEEFKASIHLESANEYIKFRMKVLKKDGEKLEDVAVQALAGDSDRANKVGVAENLLRRVIKSGSNGDAFKAKA